MTELPRAAQDALDEAVSREDPRIVGVILTGSAARGTATQYSDVDLWVVFDDDRTMSVTRSDVVDEVRISIGDLERRHPFGTDGWYQRWAFAWAQVLRDDSAGRVAAAALAQATLTVDEQWAILPDRLDGYLNFIYRAAKSDRNGRALERDLDAAESIPWMLDTIFTLNGRVRPYNSYLPWELREHPLAVPQWSADELLPQLAAITAGDLDAIRAGYEVIEGRCRAFDAMHGRSTLSETLDWGDDFTALLRPR